MPSSPVDLTKNEIARPLRLREIEDDVHQRLKRMQNNRSDTEKAYQAKLQEINASIDRFYDAIATGLDPDVCKRKIDELLQQKALLEGELKDRTAGLKAAEAFANDMVVIRKMARNFETEFAQLPFDKRRLLILHFVERIDILDHSVASVTLRIPKLTPGKTLKPPMAKKTRLEIELEAMGGGSIKGQQKASPDRNQVRLARLPMCNPLHNPSRSPAVNRKPSISTSYQRACRSL